MIKYSGLSIGSGGKPFTENHAGVLESGNLSRKLPSYFSMEEGFDYRVSKEEVVLIRANRGYLPKTKVRGIRWLFRSGLLAGDNGEDKSLLFLYLSTPGKRQEIDVVIEDGTFTTKDSLKIRCF